MTRLQVLGATSVAAGDGRELDRLAAGPKRLAVVAWLALQSPRGFSRRDSMVAMFWPESDQERARSSLRNLLHTLRRELGPEALETRGAEEVRLAPQHVTCDALEFQDAYEGGRWEDALRLYCGDLLDGFFLSGAEEFERWLESERARLRGLAVRAAWAAADGEQTEGRPGAAAAWMRRALELAPYDETALERCVNLLLEAGDRSAATQACVDFAQRFRTELGDDAGEAVRQLQERIRASPGAEPPAVQTPAAPSGWTAPGRLVRPQPVSSPTASRVMGRRRAATMVLGAVAVALSVAWGTTFLKGSAEKGSAVLVLPFTVRGTDPSLDFLSEGARDLVAAAFTGEGGPRSAGIRGDRPSVRASLPGRGEADLAAERALAERVGADELVLGEVVGTRERLFLSASLHAVRHGSLLAEAMAAGPADSLDAVADRLVAVLLAARAGDSGASLDEHRRVPVPAVRAWLMGEEAHQLGEYDRAVSHYLRALEMDSTYAPAILGLSVASRWGIRPDLMRLGPRLAAAARDRFTSADLKYLEALQGRDGPLSTPYDPVTLWERAVDANPGRPEAWYELGDVLLHWGPIYGRDPGRERALASLRHALQLDSTFAMPLGHVIELEALNGDGASASRHLERLREVQPQNDLIPYLEWLTGLARDDRRALDRVRRRIPSLPTASLLRIAGTGILERMPVEDIRNAARTLQHRLAPRSEEKSVAEFLEHAWMVLGDTAAAMEANRTLERASGDQGQFLRNRIGAALFGDVDPTLAEDAARRLGALAGAGPVSTVDETLSRLSALAALHEWRLWQGQTEGAREAIRRLRAVDGSYPPGYREAYQVHAEYLEALLARAEKRSDDVAIGLERLDSLLRATLIPGLVLPAGYLASARMWVELGHPDRARTALRQRPYHHFQGIFWLAAILRLEGELALIQGDTAAASRASEHYLRLRPHEARNGR